MAVLLMLMNCVVWYACALSVIWCGTMRGQFCYVVTADVILLSTMENGRVC